jgi:hypothetical protein
MEFPHVGEGIDWEIQKDQYDESIPKKMERDTRSSKPASSILL